MALVKTVRNLTKSSSRYRWLVVDNGYICWLNACLDKESELLLKLLIPCEFVYKIGETLMKFFETVENTETNTTFDRKGFEAWKAAAIQNLM